MLAGEKEAEKEMGEDEDEDDEDTCKLFAEVSLSLLLSSLELSDTNVYAPSIRALLGTALCFCEVVVLPLFLLSIHCRANAAHVRHSGSNAGLSSWIKALKSFGVIP